MLTATDSRLEFINRFNMISELFKLTININPLTNIKIININRNINNLVKWFIYRIESNINTINTADKFQLTKSSNPFTSFREGASNKSEREITSIKKNKPKVKEQGININSEYSNFVSRTCFESFNNPNRGNNNKSHKNIIKKNTKCRVFVIKKVVKHINEPPFKKISNQGGDDGSNNNTDNSLNIHNATSKGFCQLSSSPFYYSPVGVAKK